MPFFDFSEDVGDEIKRIIGEILPPQLDPARVLAGQQLELLKSVLFAWGAGAFYAGPATMVTSETIVIVLAGTKKLVTYYIKPQQNITLLAAVFELTQYARDQLPGMFDLDTKKILEGPAAGALAEVIKKYGEPPGKPSSSAIKISERLQQLQLGVIFSLLEDDASYIDKITKCVNNGVCPAIVVLVGPATSRRRNYYSLVVAQLALARYNEAVEAELNEAG